LPEKGHRAESATLRINLAEPLASDTGWVYVARMNATINSIGERIASAAGSLCFGMPLVAVRSDITHTG
jgi:hypothetical protein